MSRQVLLAEAAGTVTQGYGLDVRGIVVRYRVVIRPALMPTLISYPMDTGISFPEVKTVDA